MNLNKMIPLKICSFVMCLLLFQGVLLGTTENVSVLSIENEFIKIVVNHQHEDQGRFAVETILGNPETPSDDYQSLIFGRPIPWTSYTTLLIDGEPYIFGGPTEKLNKRRGKPIKTGQVLSQEITAKGIETRAQVGPVVVTQTLSFFRSPFTRVKDASLISYDVVNTDSEPHEVGIRVMLDTMLGSNDGAPFRIGDQAITAEKRFVGTDIVDYWQTFDHLETPKIVAQGTLIDGALGIYPPDRMALVNWGTLADHPWEFAYQENRSFIREGEFEQDTALALYWDPFSVPPKGNRGIKTLYGLGGLSVTPGDLSLGITAPAEVYQTSQQPFLIVAYVLNSGGFDSLDTTVTFDLPEGFKIVEGQKTVQVGVIPSGETLQIPLRVQLDRPSIGTQTIGVSVQSKTLESNKTSRDIAILAPPALQTRLLVSKDKNTDLIPFYTVKQTLYNPSRFVVNDVKSRLTLPEGLGLASFDIIDKPIQRLLPGREVNLNWKIYLTEDGLNKETLPVRVTTMSKGLSNVTALGEVTPPPLRPKLYYDFSETAFDVGQYFYITLKGEALAPFEDAELVIMYDNTLTDFVRWSPEWWAVEQDIQVIHRSDRLIVKGLSLDTFQKKVHLGKLHFKAVQEGALTLSLFQNQTAVYEDTIQLNYVGRTQDDE